MSFAQESLTDKKLESFIEVAEDLFNKAALPGAGIAIVHEGEVIYKGGLGFTDLQSKERVTENSLFLIGSTTKAFTGFAAARLVDRQVLDWKKPIINYLPDFTLSEPYVAKHVNLEDLFTHMTGLAQKDDLWLGKALTREEVYQQTRSLEFANSFRGGWAYNNHAYVIIGKVLEKVANKSWEALIQEEIFKPLGMTKSYLTHQEFLEADHHVTGYYGDGKTVRPHINSDNIGPAGAISSTPNDVSKWMQMLINKGNYKGEQLISTQEYDYLMGPKGMSFSDTCTVNYYSIGWGGIKTNGRRTLIHSGAIGGNNARVLIKPDEGFGIFVMTNQRSEYKTILVDYAESIFVNGNFKRDLKRENKLISLNRFIRFQNTLLDEGPAAAKTYHASLKYKDFESDMLMLGQSLLLSGYKKEALLVFELNVVDHPDSYQAHDKYAKLLVLNGNKEQAIEMYKKSLEINPDNEDTKEALEKLLK